MMACARGTAPDKPGTNLDRGVATARTDTAPDATAPDGTAPDATPTPLDGRAGDGPCDASPDGPSGHDPCTPNPCQNGGTCAPEGAGGVQCTCATGFTGPTCSACALGFSGPRCSTCPQARLAIKACSSPRFDCSAWIDGTYDVVTHECSEAQEPCFPTDVDLDLGARFFVDRIRFLSDWWSKKPKTWDVWASDDNTHFVKIMSASSNPNPWQCVSGEPCHAAVPTECCPDGKTQDVSNVGEHYPLWDDFRFTGVVARYVRFRLLSTFTPVWLIMRELELYGHACLGELTCATSTCATGLCTNQDKATCACQSCKPEAHCTSAFAGTAPACATP